jgi:glycosyltransferase involved in cell wall biosynthesis
VRVLVINSMFVNAVYRRCADELGAIPGVDLTVLTTDGWIMNGKPMPLSPIDAAAPYRLIVGKARWKGKENRGFYVDGITKALREARPDVIFLMEEPFSVFALQILGFRKIICPHVPVVFFTWNNLSFHKYDYRPSVAYRNFAKINLRNMQYGLTANRAGVEALREFGFERPIDTIGYGVDTERYATSDPDRVRSVRTSLGFRESDPVIGYVGRLLPMKGLDLLIEAFQKVRSGQRDAKLLIVGSGDAEAELRQQVESHGLSSAVRFVPVVPHAEVPSYMHAIDILVLPSRRVGMWAEQFGRVLVEAMAAGKIVIGSTSGAIPEVIGVAGFTFKENNADHLASVLSSSLKLSAEDRVTVAQRARERATRDHSWKRFASDAHRVLTRAVEAGV